MTRFVELKPPEQKQFSGIYNSTLHVKEIMFSPNSKSYARLVWRRTLDRIRVAAACEPSGASGLCLHNEPPVSQLDRRCQYVAYGTCQNILRISANTADCSFLFHFLQTSRCVPKSREVEAGEQ